MTSTSVSRAATLAAALVLGAGVAACGSSNAQGVALVPGDGATSAAVTGARTASAPTTATTALNATTPTSGPLSKEPSGLPTSAKAPTKLEVKDLITGTGKIAAPGDQLAVNYVGALYKNGKVFDASWRDTPGKAFQFQLGVGAVIKGWDQGLQGMKVGGRRELIIPAPLAYGPSGQGATIPPNAALVFVVDLLDVGRG